MRDYSRVMQAFKSTVWAIQPEKAEAILALLEFRSSGQRYTPEEIEARVGVEAAAGKTAKPVGKVAIIPMLGVISQRLSLMDDVSGGGSVSTDGFAKVLRAAVNDPEVSAIVLDVDSPGGSVYGVAELSKQIFDARQQKKIYAVANSLAASAAYWLATSADKLFVTPSGEVGSVGVLSIHEDRSEANAKDGYRYEVIKAGQYKAEDSPFAPLTDDARAFIQARVDEYYGMFVESLARNRAMKKRDVDATFGQGRIFGAKDAVARGMADGIKTLDEVIALLTK